jgi:hypothetical protein
MKQWVVGYQWGEESTSVMVEAEGPTEALVAAKLEKPWGWNWDYPEEVG